jgi:hypothetical protein
MRTLALLLALSPLAACGYDVHYEGRVVDDNGVARQGLAVQLAGVDFAERRHTAADTIARIQASQTVVTDENGRFEMTEHVTPGFFGCGVGDGSHPAVVISPDGPEGAVLVKKGIEDDRHQVAIGELRMPPTVDMAVNEWGVLVAMPRSRPAEALVRVDESTWFAGDGILPAAALAACETDAACDHKVSMSWVDGDAELRSAIRTFSSKTAKPAFQSTLGAGDLEADLGSPMEVDSIFIDGLFPDGDLSGFRGQPIANTGIAVIADPRFPVAANLPTDACVSYGTGLRCTGPVGPIASVIVEGRGQETPRTLRIFAR